MSREETEGPKPQMNAVPNEPRPTSDDAGDRAQMLPDPRSRFELNELYEELEEGRRVNRILWYVAAVFAGAMLAVILYLVH